MEVFSELYSGCNAAGQAPPTQSSENQMKLFNSPEALLNIRVILWEISMLTFQIEILLDVLNRKEKLPESDIEIEFWPQWAGNYGLPCVTTNNSKSKTNSKFLYD